MAEEAQPPSYNDGTPSTATKVRPRHRTKNKVNKLPPYNVVLLDDDEHTFDYVIEMLGKVFSFAVEKSFLIAKEVDSEGRVIVLTTHKELAELKRDQIVAYGPDQRIAACTQSMRAVIEPAEG